MRVCINESDWTTNLTGRYVFVEWDAKIYALEIRTVSVGVLVSIWVVLLVK